METQELINFYLEQGILISPEIVDILETCEFQLNSDFSVITLLALESIRKKVQVSIPDIEKATVLKEKHKNSALYSKFIEYMNNSELLAKAAKISETSFLNLKNAAKPTLDSDSSNDLMPTQFKSSHNISDEELSESATSNEQNIMDKKIVDNKIPISSSDSSNNSSDAFDTSYYPDTSIPGFNMEEYRKDFLKRHRAKIVMNYVEKSKKRSVADFVAYFNNRYKDIEKILRQRTELQNLTSIKRITEKKEKENVAFIGYVFEKSITKNNNIMFTIEDPTGSVKVVVTKNKEDAFNLAQEIQLDEIIGVTGTWDKLVFANNILLPDVPLTKELKKSPEEGYFLVITDTQVGNKLFLDKEFRKFIQWINGEIGTEVQKELASKIKYIFIVGDLVDGVGIYPDQEYDLSIIDITDQYNAFTEYLKLFPKNVPIFICPGNHDVGRLSEPQPAFHDEYSKSMQNLPNIFCVSNPSVINIFSNPEQGFDGFDVLLYHGASFIYYAYNIPSIRQAGNQKRPDLIMKYLLQRRHLAPTHSSALYVPDAKKDYLTIEKVPDFFFSGHIHRTSVSNYRNVTCINASCWVSKSEEQERRGLEPQPARAFIINMQNREVKIMNFSSKDDTDTADTHDTSDGGLQTAANQANNSANGGSN